MPDEYLRIPALPLVQPIGQFYIGVISYRDLIQISFADMRRIERELDRYVGIQRKLMPQRVVEIGRFVNTIDATFPTSIVLAIPGACARYDEATRELVLSESTDEATGEKIAHYEIAKILDGQHRIEGLKALTSGVFQLAVSIFVEEDIADQAYIFATVNLSQTKVNRSLVYDLLDYTTARSPQRSCHDIAVAVDRHERSPLKDMIKRLGNATPGRTGETLTQATFVDSLLPMISIDPLGDREKLARGKAPKFDAAEYAKVPFRHLWLAERETDIAKSLMEYFAAIAERWPISWASRERGNILPRTNGFRALMRLLKNIYLRQFPQPTYDVVIDKEMIAGSLRSIDLKDGDFTTELFPPGTSGEKLLYDRLRSGAGV